MINATATNVTKIVSKAERQINTRKRYEKKTTEKELNRKTNKDRER